MHDVSIHGCGWGVVGSMAQVNITSSKIFSNDIGVYLISCHASNVYGNIIAWNRQYNAQSSSSSCNWDDGISIGNAWDNYTGIGNYSINGGDIDHYPTLITDDTVPTVQSLDNFQVEVGAKSTITWHPKDSYPGNYTLLVNDSVVETNYWCSNGLEVEIPSYGIGIYNFTVLIADAAGNTATTTVFVTIVDTIAPSIDAPDDITFDEGDTGYTIVWSPFDFSPDSYIIRRNGTIVHSGSWNTSDEVITFSLDGLEYGIYNISITVFDKAGLYITDFVIVTVVDALKPTIDSPHDVVYVVGATGNTIEWSPQDLHPSNYVIYRDGLEIMAGLWNSTSETILISVDGLDVGQYNFTIVVYDQSGNNVSDTVIVNVTSGSTVTTTLPPTTTSTSGLPFPLSTEIIVIIAVGIGAIALVVVVVWSRKSRVYSPK